MFVSLLNGKGREMLRGGGGGRGGAAGERAILNGNILLHYEQIISFNPSHTGRLFHRYMLDKFTCHFRGVSSILWLLFCF